MNINRNNYEKYFIDYLEGTLSKDDIHDLRVFLLFNQDLAELLDDIAKIKLTVKKTSKKMNSMHVKIIMRSLVLRIRSAHKIFQTLSTLPVNKK